MPFQKSRALERNSLILLGDETLFLIDANSTYVKINELGCPGLESR
jgi:hypothetical protein